jgi:hypothetical protein
MTTVLEIWVSQAATPRFRSSRDVKDLILVALGMVCGVSFKAFDLWAEHGLKETWYGKGLVGVAALGR